MSDFPDVELAPDYKEKVKGVPKNLLAAENEPLVYVPTEQHRLRILPVSVALQYGVVVPTKKERAGEGLA